MRLSVVGAEFIDRAWADGAHTLSEACDMAGGEITTSQLKMMLARGERTLLALMDGDNPVGWVVVRVDQMPNFRVLHVTELVAHNASFEAFWPDIERMAKSLGCSRVRGSAKPAQARLYRQKLGFTPVYETLEREIQ